MSPQLAGVQEAGASPTAPMLALPASQGLVHLDGQEAGASPTAPMLAFPASQGLLHLDGQEAGASPTAPICAAPEQQEPSVPQQFAGLQQGLVQSAGQAAPLAQHGLLQPTGHSLIAPGLVDALLPDWVELQPATSRARHNAVRVKIDLMNVTP